MRRRDLILGLLAVATIDGAHAEQSRKLYRIAYVQYIQLPNSLKRTGPEEHSRPL